MGILDFWDMTPVEVIQTMEAAGWRADVEQRLMAWGAWHMAALQRCKRMPALASLIKPKKARVLEGQELEDRRREFEEMKTRWAAKQHR